MIRKPRIISGIKPHPAQNRNFEILKVSGRGLFVSMQITKVGGTNDFAAITLSIDGEPVVSSTFISVLNAGLGNPNNSGLILTNSTIAKSITVQFNEPLYFSRNLKLVFNAHNDTNINNVIASAVIGEFIQNPLDEIVVPPRDTFTAKRRKKK